MSAPKAEVSYVQYFIPTDGDSEEHPNVFVVRKSPKSLCLGDIVSAFPLPGEYLFRAKYSYGKTHGKLNLSQVTPWVSVETLLFSFLTTYCSFFLIFSVAGLEWFR